VCCDQIRRSIRFFRNDQGGKNLSNHVQRFSSDEVARASNPSVFAGGATGTTFQRAEGYFSLTCLAILKKAASCFKLLAEPKDFQSPKLWATIETLCHRNADQASTPLSEFDCLVVG